MISIVAKDLKKVYGNDVVALSDINFEVKPGEKVMLLGHNGSGKSTLFKCLTGFERPTEGKVFIGDTDITSLKKNEFRNVRKQVGLVFQNFNLINNISVFQNVLYGALGGNQGFRKTLNAFASDEMRYKAMECLDRVSLAEFANRRADQLSGGQKQRVAIARTIMQEPEIILADEPVASLDPKVGREVMDLLWDVADERGLAVICILHQMDIVKEYGERIIALKDGKIVKDDLIENIEDSFFKELYELDKADESEVK
ncbi:MAG: phosphonate ABC transporter ATP-binding protein [Erysipelotrichaceae bacterium]|nr:phosphonate ABC transporter ATP-binding protein [Erysipelotrichaceae bacterium]